MNNEWHKAESFTESVRHAWRGLIHVIEHEKNFMIQVVFLGGAIVAAALLEISIAQFMVVILVAAALLAFEMVNTALEMLADVVQPQYHEKIGLLKDVTAGAVLVVAAAAIIIGLMIYGTAIVEIGASI